MWSRVIILLFTIISPIRGFHRPEKCDCFSSCYPDVVILNGKGCPKCPVCPICPEISTTPSIESTQSPRCSLPGYKYLELSSPGVSRCFKIGNLSVGKDLSDSLCAGGAEILYFNDPSEVSDIQAWAWKELGSDHVMIWTSGKEYQAGYKWRVNSVNIILSSYTWAVSEPSQGSSACLFISHLSGKLGFGSCYSVGLTYMCQFAAVS